MQETLAPVPRTSTAAPDVGRLVVVSNRLPFAVERTDDGIALRRTVGGLVSGVEAYLAARRARSAEATHVWVGWPGAQVAPRARRAFAARARAEHGAVPVFLDEDRARRFYEGFCNRALWPLVHYFPSLVQVDDAEWRTYRDVNVAFRDAVLEVLEPGDTVWIHDYHLLLLPALLREAVPDLPIAFFLHVPFPAYDVLRVLPDPWAREILWGILGADLVGVHTYDYARHILRAASRILGLEHRQGEVFLPQRVARVDVFPMGVEFERFSGAAEADDVREERGRLEAALGGRRAVLSVDRLDYSKGLHHRVLAFERFLERNPAWHDRVCLVMVAVPSRVGISDYRAMKTRIDEAVGRVNGRFGHVGWTPILYRFRPLDQRALTAHYAASDVALVTPLRDGMNLVAKEYVATRADGTGVLVLSDTAGAARELGEAVLVNPHHVDGIAEAIRDALEMPVEEQRRRNDLLRTRLRRYDVVRWGDEQLERLRAARERVGRYRARRLPAETMEHELARWRAARRRLLLLDYDGTLVPFQPSPDRASPEPEVLDVIERLANDPANRVVLVSGRDAATLDAWFGHLPVVLVAEHGLRSSEPGLGWSPVPASAAGWQELVLPILQVFADRLPGSFVETKDACLAWHYRAADEDLGPVRARELAEALRGVKAPRDFHVLSGAKVVEVRPAGTTKALAARHWLARTEPDFVLAAGDDATDEDLFAELPESALSIRVGLRDSMARFNVEDPPAFVALLRAFADVERGPSDDRS